MNFEFIDNLNKEDATILYDDAVLYNGDEKAHCWGLCQNRGNSICVISGTQYTSFSTNDGYCMYLCYAHRLNNCVADSYTGTSWQYYGLCPGKCQ